MRGFFVSTRCSRKLRPLTSPAGGLTRVQGAESLVPPLSMPQQFRPRRPSPAISRVLPALDVCLDRGEERRQGRRRCLQLRRLRPVVPYRVDRGGKRMWGRGPVSAPERSVEDDYLDEVGRKQGRPDRLHQGLRKGTDPPAFATPLPDPLVPDPRGGGPTCPGRPVGGGCGGATSVPASGWTFFSVSGPLVPSVRTVMDETLLSTSLRTNPLLPLLPCTASPERVPRRRPR